MSGGAVFFMTSVSRTECFTAFNVLNFLFLLKNLLSESITQSINLAPQERRGVAEAPKDTTASDTHGRAAESARRMARSIITRSGGTQVAAARKGSTSAHDELIS